MDVICVHAASFTKESVRANLCSSMSFLIVGSALAWFCLFQPLLHGEYEEPNLTVSPSLLGSLSSLLLANSPPLSAKNPCHGNPTHIHHQFVSAVMIVSAFLFIMSFPCMHRVNESIIHRMYLDPNSLRSKVTTSLKTRDLGNITWGLATNLLNLWLSLQSFTTWW